MFTRTKPRKALSTVIVTLIILVASVVLGTGVVLYGTSLFQTGAQSSSLTATGVKVWVDAKYSNGTAWGAVDIRNSGDKLLSVDNIQVRGQAVPFASWYVDSNAADVTTTNFQQSLNYTGLQDAEGWLVSYVGKGSIPAGCTTTISLPTAPTAIAVNLVGTSTSAPGSANPVLCLQQSSGPISLQPGAKAIVYFRIPQSALTTVDAGSASSVAIYAGQVGAPQSVTVASQTY